MVGSIPILLRIRLLHPQGFIKFIHFSSPLFIENKKSPPSRIDGGPGNQSTQNLAPPSTSNIKTKQKKARIPDNACIAQNAA
jgi:hypothetical protein